MLAHQNLFPQQAEDFLSRAPLHRLRPQAQRGTETGERFPPLCVLEGNGLRDHRPARPTLTPPIRFLSIGSHFCSTLPSDPASRRRPCASLTLHLHPIG